jgi:hypothetical protein
LSVRTQTFAAARGNKSLYAKIIQRPEERIQNETDISLPVVRKFTTIGKGESRDY